MILTDADGILVNDVGAIAIIIWPELNVRDEQYSCQTRVHCGKVLAKRNTSVTLEKIMESKGICEGLLNEFVRFLKE